MKKKIAIVGGGLSGLLCANLLHKDHEISLFESKPYLGGHCYTHHLEVENKVIEIDLGFVLFNDQAYPKLLNLLKRFHIPFEQCDLSFSFYSRNLIKYKGPHLGNPFLPWRNVFSKNSYQLLFEIIKFNNHAQKYLQHKLDDEKFGDFLNKHDLTPLFLQGYLLPLMNTFWSCPWENLHELPATFVLRYLQENSLLETFLSPNWYFVRGGAKTMTAPICHDFRQRIHLNSPIDKIERDKFHVTLHHKKGADRFDALILAVQADQALKMLVNPSPLELHILSTFEYNNRQVYLHTDKNMMPPRKKYWSALNYIDDHRRIMTYHANKSQNFKSKLDYFITISEGKPVTPGKIIIQTQLNRPKYSLENVHNQKRHPEINGILNTYYAGSYWGYGTLEDAIASAYLACQPFNVTIPT